MCAARAWPRLYIFKCNAPCVCVCFLCGTHHRAHTHTTLAAHTRKYVAPARVSVFGRHATSRAFAERRDVGANFGVIKMCVKGASFFIAQIVFFSSRMRVCVCATFCHRRAYTWNFSFFIQKLSSHRSLRARAANSLTKRKHYPCAAHMPEER